MRPATKTTLVRITCVLAIALSSTIAAEISLWSGNYAIYVNALLSDSIDIISAVIGIRTLGSFKFNSTNRYLSPILASLGVGFLCLYLGTHLSSLMPRTYVPIRELQEMGQTSSRTMIKDGYIFLTLLFLIVTPFAEELAFRGFIQGLLKNRFSALVSILIASLIFASLHAYHGPKAIIFAFLVGIACGWLRERFGLLFSSLAHIFINFVALANFVYEIDYSAMAKNSLVFSISIATLMACSFGVFLYEVSQTIRRKKA